MPAQREPQLIKASPPFEMFYLTQYCSVLGLAYSLSGSQGAAEDLTQEAFLRAHRHWDQIADYAEPWVRRVAINLAKSRLRRIQAEAKAMLRHGPQPSAMSEISPPTQDFWEQVRRLPRRQAQAVALHYLEDLSVRQISEVLQISDGAVKAALFKGRNQLAKRLGVEGGDAI